MTEFTFKHPEQVMLARLHGLLPRCANCTKIHSDQCPSRGRMELLHRRPSHDKFVGDYPTCEEFTFHAPESQEP